MRDLYAAAPRAGSSEGRTRHYVLVPADDARSSTPGSGSAFGAQHAHGIQEIPRDARSRCPTDSRPTAAAGRRSRSSSASASRCPATRAARPCSRARRRRPRRRSRAEWLETFAGDERRVLIGDSTTSRVACWSVVSGRALERAAGLARPGARRLPRLRRRRSPRRAGSGIGVALTNACSRGRASRATGRWSRTGARRTCSPRASGRGAASAAPSCGSTARSLDPAPAARTARGSRRRRRRERRRLSPPPPVDPIADVGGRGPRRASLPTLRPAARGARAEGRPRDDRRRTAGAPDPRFAQRPAANGDRRGDAELERGGATSDRQTLLVAGGLRAAPHSASSSSSSLRSSHAASAAGSRCTTSRSEGLVEIARRRTPVRVNRALVETDVVVDGHRGGDGLPRRGRQRCSPRRPHVPACCQCLLAARDLRFAAAGSWRSSSSAPSPGESR